MKPFYRDDREFHIRDKKQFEIRPHFHPSMELVCVTKGSIIAGIEKKLYPLSCQDIVLIFPDQINLFHVPDKKENRAIHFHITPAYWGPYADLLQNCAPVNPVIRREEVPNTAREILHHLLSAASAEKRDKMPGSRAARQSAERIGTVTRENIRETSPLIRRRAEVELLLSLLLPKLEFQERTATPSDSLVDQVVRYMAANYRNPVTLTGLSRALGTSPYVLSRIFSGTFRQNFNHYLNDLRLDYASVLLTETEERITDICLDAGFQSQATFNRAFREKFGMTPREYRNA